MKTYNLGCAVTVSAYTRIVAASLEEAIEVASYRDVVLGGPCSGADPSEEWVIEEADGSPTDIRADD
jgi:hypothetical protein